MNSNHIVDATDSLSDTHLVFILVLKKHLTSKIMM